MRSRSTLLLYAAAALFVAGCGRESSTPPQPGPSRSATAASASTSAEPQDLTNARVNTVIAPEEKIYVDRARIGSALGNDGMVEVEKTEFARDEPVYLSMWFRESPAGLQARFRVEDSKGSELRAEQKAMNGQKNVTFTVGDRKLKPGNYKVIGYWGGNIAAEYEFSVEDRRSATPSKAKRR